MELSGTEPGLTPRQRDVVETALQLGRTDSRRLAEVLGIAPCTADNHWEGILEALGAHSRFEAIERALELGLARDPRRPAP